MTGTFPLLNCVNALRCWVAAEEDWPSKLSSGPAAALNLIQVQWPILSSVRVGPQTPHPQASFLPSNRVTMAAALRPWGSALAQGLGGLWSWLVLTAGGGRLGITAAALGWGRGPEWVVGMVGTGSGECMAGAGAMPFAGPKPLSWNRGLESPMVVLGATFLPRK